VAIWLWPCVLLKDYAKHAQALTERVCQSARPGSVIQPQDSTSCCPNRTNLALESSVNSVAISG
jgi:hypothetical protein